MLLADTAPHSADTARYAKCIAASKLVRWDIDDDVIRGRSFDFSRHFLPKKLSGVDRLEFLSAVEQRMLSHVQGRTYANMFCLVERFIGAKILEISREHWLGDQVALEALVRMTDEELKHQALFRRIEQMIGAAMPHGYTFTAEPNAVAGAVMAASTWAVLALTCHIELFTQSHYRDSLAPDSELCELYKDVFLFHWKEESQHAILDEIEWRREDARLTHDERDAAVGELIGLVAAVDGIASAQAASDADYFLQVCGRTLNDVQAERVATSLKAAYRWQYIGSGVQNARFSAALSSMISLPQSLRIADALAPLVS